MTSLLIANGISFIAAIFTAKSSWARDRWHIYIYQTIQCLLLAIASFFFHSYAGIVSLVIASFRNYLAACGKLNRRWMIICMVLVVVTGLLVNNLGWVGGLIISTNVIYTLGMYFAKQERTMKYNIILNLTLWMIYEIMIIDIPSLVADGIGLVVAVASLFRERWQKD